MDFTFPQQSMATGAVPDGGTRAWDLTPALLKSTDCVLSIPASKSWLSVRTSSNATLKNTQGQSSKSKPTTGLNSPWAKEEKEGNFLFFLQCGHSQLCCPALLHYTWTVHIFFPGLTQSPVWLEGILTDLAMAGNRPIMSNVLCICARTPSIYALTEITVCPIVMCHKPATVLFFPVELHATTKKKNKVISSQVTVWWYFCKILWKIHLGLGYFLTVAEVTRLYQLPNMTRLTISLIRAQITNNKSECLPIFCRHVSSCHTSCDMSYL